MRAVVRRLWRLLLRLTLAGGLLYGALLLLLAQADGLRGEVAGLAGAALGHEVRIERLSASLGAAGPELVAHGIAVVGTDGRPLLGLGSLRLALDLAASLQQGVPVVEQLTFVGAELRLIRRPDASLTVQGLEGLIGAASETATTDAATLPALLRFEGGRLNWEDQTAALSPLGLAIVRIELQRRPGPTGERLHLSAALRLGEGGLVLGGDLQQAADGWQGDLFLRGQGLDPNPLLAGRLPRGYRLEQGAASFDLFAELAAGRARTIEGRIDLRELRLSDAPAHPQPSLELHYARLGADLRWRREEAGWRFDLEGIELRRADGAAPPTGLGVAGRYDASQRLSLFLAAEHLRVAEAAELAMLLPLPAGGREALAGLRPQGELRRLRAGLELAPAADGGAWRIAAPPSLSGELRGLALIPWGEVPGVANLSAAFHAVEDGLVLELASADPRLEFPQLFRHPLEFRQLHGALAITARPEGGLRVSAEELIADSPHIQTRSRLRLDIPFAAGALPIIDLHTDFHDGDAAFASRYYPAGIMDEAVVAWLDQSILSGRVVSGSCVVRGDLRHFPFDQPGDPPGRFEVSFQLADLLLRYWPGWPAAAGIGARVRFLGNRFDVWAEQGRIFDSRLRNLHGWINELSTTTPFELSGELEGPLRDQLRLLTESPLREDFGSLGRRLQAEGRGGLKLAFAIPLEAGEPRLKGRLEFKDARVRLRQEGLDLSGVRGGLAFDLHGIEARGLRASAFGVPIELDLATLPNSDGALRAEVRGRLPVATLAERYPKLPAQPLVGAADWRMRIDIPPLLASDQPVRIEAESDLKGVAIELPKPFGKGRAEARELRVRSELGGAGEQSLGIRYGDLLDAQLRLDGTGALARGEVVLGGGPAASAAEALPRQGLRVRGALAELSLEGWPAFDSGAAEDLGQAPPWPADLELAIGRFDWGGGAEGAVKLRLQTEAGQWQGRVEGDTLAGAFRWPIDPAAGPAELELDRLALRFDPEAPSTPDPKAAPARSDPRRLPAFRLRIGDLRVNGRPFGRLEVEAERIPEGLHFPKLTLRSKLVEVSGSGDWTHQGGGTACRAEVLFKTPSLGKLLDALGFAATLQEAPGEMEWRVRWPGGPADLRLDDLSGVIRLVFEQGAFLEAEPGIGRIFGLLNLTALQRRLTLDFSDLFGQGLGFDKISGSFRVQDGNAYTEDLRIKSPAAEIDIRGRTDLAQRELEQRVTVTPHLSSALPVAGAIAGGPAVGAVLLLAQQVMGKGVDALTRREYKVSGPMDDPLIEPLGEIPKPAPEQGTPPPKNRNVPAALEQFGQ